ncbi:hypothetical protein GEMRC1_014161 [Eukaryota sp. GEM-RC1]
MSLSLATQELAALFPPDKSGSSFDLDTVFHVIENGSLDQCKVRSVVWMLLLELFGSTTTPPNKWNLTSKRQEYYDLRSSILVNDPSHDSLDPLSTSPECQGLWEKYFRNQRVLSLIKRTYPLVLSSLEEILLVYSVSTADDTSTDNYRQGMHELAAMFMLVRFNESIQVEEEVSELGSRPISSEEWIPVTSHLLDQNHTNADVFLMFSSLMELMLPWFLNDSDCDASSESKTDPFDPFSTNQLVKEEENFCLSGPLNTSCVEVFKILTKINPAIVAHLETLQIQPHLFLISWLRLLFLRLFHLKDVLKIWDVLLAHTPTVLAPFLAAAMLEYVSGDLIAKDFSACLKRLMSYPPVEDPLVLARKALELRFPKRSEKKKPKKSEESDVLYENRGLRSRFSIGFSRIVRDFKAVLE